MIIRENKKIFMFLAWLLFFIISIDITSYIDADDTEIRLFRIYYREAEEFIQPVKLFLSPDGTVVTDQRTNSLIVKDYPENIKAVAEFLKKEDQRPTHVRIKINFVDENIFKKLDIVVNWQYRDSHWAVGNVINDKKGLNINALIRAEKGRHQFIGEQTLLIMSGSEGRIAVGRSIPYSD